MENKDQTNKRKGPQYVVSSRITYIHEPSDDEVAPHRKDLYLTAEVEPPLVSCRRVVIRKDTHKGMGDELKVDLSKEVRMIQNGELLRLPISTPSDSFAGGCPSCRAGRGGVHIKRDLLSGPWKCHKCGTEVTYIVAGAFGFAHDVFGTHSVDAMFTTDVVLKGQKHTIITIPRLYRVSYVHATLHSDKRDVLGIAKLGFHLPLSHGFVPLLPRDSGPLLLFNTSLSGQNLEAFEGRYYAYELMVGYNTGGYTRSTGQPYEWHLMLAKDYQLQGFYTQSILEAHLASELASNLALELVFRTSGIRSSALNHGVSWLNMKRKRDILLKDMFPVDCTSPTHVQLLKELQKLDDWRDKMAHGSRSEFTREEAEKAVRAATFLILHLCAQCVSFPNSTFVDD